MTADLNPFNDIARAHINYIYAAPGLAIFRFDIVVELEPRESSVARQ